jgi:hypothetical protein
MSLNMVFYSVVTRDINNDVVIEWQKSHNKFYMDNRKTRL